MVTDVAVLQSKLNILPEGNLAVSITSSGRNTLLSTIDDTSDRTLIVDRATFDATAELPGFFLGTDKAAEHFAIANDRMLETWTKLANGYGRQFVAAQGLMVSSTFKQRLVYSDEFKWDNNRPVSDGVFGVTFPMEGSPRVWDIATGDLLVILPSELRGEGTCCLVDSQSRLVVYGMKLDLLNSLDLEHVNVARQRHVASITVTAATAALNLIDKRCDDIEDEKIRMDVKNVISMTKTHIAFQSKALEVATDLDKLIQDEQKDRLAQRDKLKSMQHPLVIWTFTCDASAVDAPTWVAARTKSELDRSNSFGIRETLTEHQKLLREIAPYAERAPD